MGYSELLRRRTMEPTDGRVNKRILIVGGGPAGASTALHLCKFGALDNSIIPLIPFAAILVGNNFDLVGLGSVPGANGPLEGSTLVFNWFAKAVSRNTFALDRLRQYHPLKTSEAVVVWSHAGVARGSKQSDPRQRSYIEKRKWK